MKTYPLSIEPWGEDGEDLVSRGHHDPVTFLAACVRYLKIDGLFYNEAETPTERRKLLSCGRHDCAGWFNDHPATRGKVDWLDPKEAAGCQRLRKIEHQWWRWLPPNKAGVGTEWEGMRHARVEDGPGAGIFPVTILRTGA